MADFTYSGGVSTGYTGFASLYAQIAGNITGYSGVPAPPVPGSTNGFMQALSDWILQGVGHQTSDFANYISTGTSSSSFVDIPGSSFSFTPAATKTYVFEVDHTLFRAVGSGNVGVRIVVDTVNGETFTVTPSANNLYWGPIHHSLAAFLTQSGTVTVKLQWFTNPGSAISVDSTCVRKWFVRG